MANEVTSGQKIARTVSVLGAQMYCLFKYKGTRIRNNKMKLE
jgi:hypothetical protein